MPISTDRYDDIFPEGAPEWAEATLRRLGRLRMPADGVAVQASLDEAVAGTLVPPSSVGGRRQRNGGHGLWRPGRAFAVRFVAACVLVAFVAGGFLAGHLATAPSPMAVSARTVLAKAVSASLPPRGHAVRLRFRVRVACPPAFRCPRAELRLWQANIGGFYIYTGSIRPQARGPIASARTRTSYGFWTKSGGGGGGGPRDSVRVEHWLLRRTHHQWPYNGLRDVAGVVGTLMDEGEMKRQIRQQPSNSDLFHVKKARFDGADVWVLPFRIDMYARSSRIYVDRQTYVFRGMRESTCVRWRYSTSDGPPPCLRFATIRMALETSRTTGVCSVPRERYAFFFRTPGFLPKRELPRKPRCGR